jgi:DivIVA domain-containing protein
MGVDQTSLDRIRNATFPSARRGYDKHEVEKFLGRLADWLETGGGDESRSDAVKRELEKVGQRTGAILAQAEESAQQIRAEAEEEARGTINTANMQATETRTEADTYATETKGSVEREAREAIEAAEAQARRIIAEAEQRRDDTEAIIGDLIRRRDDVLADTEELSGKLKTAVEQHRSDDLRALESLASPEEAPAAETEVAETEVAEAEVAGAEVAETEGGGEPQDTEEHAITTEREVSADPADTQEHDLARQPRPEQRADLRT